MLDALLQALEPPETFARGAPLWNDEHISQQMLLAHLDPEYEGASRNHAFIDRSAGWIAQTLPPADHPRLLDLGCGPGLYAERLSRAGYRVTGVDFSPRSIAYATERAQRQGDDIEYRAQDYLCLDEAGRYELALLIYCDYGALPPDARAGVMQRVHTALTPGGRFLLDVFTPEKFASFKEERHWQSRPKGGFWSEQPHLALQGNRKYPGRVTLEQTLLLEEGRQRSFYIWNQYFTAGQLASEAEAAGFTVEALYDDVAGAPHTGRADTLNMLLQKGRSHP